MDNTMGWVRLGVNLSGLGWAGFKKMDPRPPLRYCLGHSALWKRQDLNSVSILQGFS